MKRNFFITGDGSHSLRVDSLKETYHSKHGALQEASYVYIDQGFKYWITENNKGSCSIFELGFGTGLNAYLTANYAFQNKVLTRYTTIENNPLRMEEVNVLNYIDTIKVPDQQIDFIGLHSCLWNNVYKIPYFDFIKYHMDFQRFDEKEKFDVLYYDAFGAHAQPELWSEALMKRCFRLLNPGGVWVSYCAKGSVRRGLENAGFLVERLSGPPGKREMLRAVKPSKS